MSAVSRQQTLLIKMLQLNGSEVTNRNTSFDGASLSFEVTKSIKKMGLQSDRFEVTKTTINGATAR